MKKITEQQKDKISEALTLAFFESSRVAEKISAIIMEEQPNPMTAAFAFLVIDQFMEANLPPGDWVKIKNVVGHSYSQLRENGILPELEKDGDNVRPKARD